MAKTLIYTKGSPQSVKISDTSTSLFLQLADNNVNVDLTAVSSITVKIADSARNYLKDISIDKTTLSRASEGVVAVPLSSDNVGALPSGTYFFEVWVVDSYSAEAIYPDVNFAQFRIVKNIQGDSIGYTSLTVQEFSDEISDMQTDLEEKVDSGYFKGDKGDTGTGVSSSAVTYQLSDSGTTTPTGTWSSSVLAQTTDEPYLWTKTVITYTDSTTTTMYSVSKKGDTGSVDNDALTNAEAFQDLQTQVDNSAVGTNLLLSSGNYSSVPSNLLNGNTTAMVASYDSDNSALVFTKATDVSAIHFGFNISPRLTVGNTYTSSITYKKSSTKTKLTIQCSNGSTSQATGLALTADEVSDFTTVSVTFSATYNHNTLWFSSSDMNVDDYIEIKEAKLEKGSVATDHSLNPGEILTTTDYAKIQAAIVALGGTLS